MITEMRSKAWNNALLFIYVSLTLFFLYLSFSLAFEGNLWCFLSFLVAWQYSCSARGIMLSDKRSWPNKESYPFARWHPSSIEDMITHERPNAKL
jgi:hypothetical protein